jgi:hypothetical protein
MYFNRWIVPENWRSKRERKKERERKKKRERKKRGINRPEIATIYFIQF